MYNVKFPRGNAYEGQKNSKKFFFLFWTWMWSLTIWLAFTCHILLFLHVHLHLYCHGSYSITTLFFWQCFKWCSLSFEWVKLIVNWGDFYRKMKSLKFMLMRLSRKVNTWREKMTDWRICLLILVNRFVQKDMCCS